MSGKIFWTPFYKELEELLKNYSVELFATRFVIVSVEIAVRFLMRLLFRLVSLCGECLSSLAIKTKSKSLQHVFPSHLLC